MISEDFPVGVTVLIFRYLPETVYVLSLFKEKSTSKVSALFFVLETPTSTSEVITVASISSLILLILNDPKTISLEKRIVGISSFSEQAKKETNKQITIKDLVSFIVLF